MTAGDNGCAAYTVIAWGVGLSHERLDIAGPRVFYSLEGNMCGTVTRGADALPGSNRFNRWRRTPVFALPIGEGGGRRTGDPGSFQDRPREVDAPCRSKKSIGWRCRPGLCNEDFYPTRRVLAGTRCLRIDRIQSNRGRRLNSIGLGGAVRLPHISRAPDHGLLTARY